MANRRSSGHIATQAGAIRMAQDAYMADRDEENRRVRQEVADNNNRLELVKMMQAQGIADSNRAWDKTKWEKDTGLKESEFKAGEELRAATLEKARLDNERAKREMAGGWKTDAQNNPLKYEEMINDFSQYIEVPPEGLSPTKKQAIAQGIYKGVPPSAIAGPLGLKMKPVEQKSENVVVGLGRKLIGRPAPVFAPAVDPDARTWEEYRVGIQPPSVQPAQAPSESPELKQARAFVDYAKKRAKDDPAWMDSLDQKGWDEVNAAFDLVESSGQPSPAIQPPTQPVNEAPRGKIVTDQELLAQTRDADGDKQITKADLDAQYARMLNVTQTLDAKPDAVAKLTPPLLKKYREAQLYVQRYEKAMQADMDKKIAGAR